MASKPPEPPSVPEQAEGRQQAETPKWDQIEADPDFQALDWTQKVQIKKDYWDTYVSRDPDYLSMEKPDQETMASDFFRTPQAEEVKDEFDETGFQMWYSDWAEKTGLDPDPDDPEHLYDYREAYKAGVEPEVSQEDGQYHWPSQFKAPDHPNRFVEGIDTKTGQPGSPPPESVMKGYAEKSMRPSSIPDEGGMKPYKGPISNVRMDLPSSAQLAEQQIQRAMQAEPQRAPYRATREQALADRMEKIKRGEYIDPYDKPVEPPSGVIPGMVQAADIRPVPTPKTAAEVSKDLEEELLADIKGRKGELNFTRDLLPELLSTKGIVERAPFSPLEAMEAYDLYRAAKRVHEGKSDGYDELLLNDLYMAQREAQERGTTFGYDVFNVLSQLPGFYVEMGATGPLYRWTKKGAEEAAGQVIMRFVKDAAEKTATNVAKKAAGKIAGSAARGVALFPTMGVPRGLMEMVENPEDDFISAMAKGYGDTFIEVLTEVSGGLVTNPLGRAFSRLPGAEKIQALKMGLMNTWLRANPGKRARDFEKLLEKVHWHGVIGEMEEERLGELLRGATGLQPMELPSMRQLMTEAVAFSVPGASARALDYAVNRPSQFERFQRQMSEFGRLAQSGLPIEEIHRRAPKEIKELIDEELKKGTKLEEIIDTEARAEGEAKVGDYITYEVNGVGPIEDRVVDVDEDGLPVVEIGGERVSIREPYRISEMRENVPEAEEPPGPESPELPAAAAQDTAPGPSAPEIPESAQPPAEEAAAGQEAPEAPEIAPEAPSMEKARDEARRRLEARRKGKEAAAGPAEEQVQPQEPQVEAPEVQEKGQEPQVVPEKLPKPYEKGQFSDVTEEVPVSFVDKFKEFDRAEEPKTPGKAREAIEEMKASIAKEGFKEPLILSIGQQDRKAILGEGNTRLAAAKELGLETVPVRVIRQSEILNERAQLADMSQVPAEGYFPADAKPSQVFDELAVKPAPARRGPKPGKTRVERAPEVYDEGTLRHYIATNGGLKLQTTTVNGKRRYMEEEERMLLQNPKGQRRSTSSWYADPIRGDETYTLDQWLEILKGDHMIPQGWGLEDLRAELSDKPRGHRGTNPLRDDEKIEDEDPYAMVPPEHRDEAIYADFGKLMSRAMSARGDEAAKLYQSAIDLIANQPTGTPWDWESLRQMAEEGLASARGQEDQEKRAQIDEEARKAEPEPSEKQKESGVYRKGHVGLHGLDISIETAKGGIRRGTDRSGSQWSQKMTHDYGQILGYKGKDKDHVDVFLGENPKTGNIFIIDQVNPGTSDLDEHKVMMGFASIEEARQGYLSNYETGWQGLGSITQVTPEELKKWLESGNKNKWFRELKSSESKPEKEEPSLDKAREEAKKRLEARKKAQEKPKEPKKPSEPEPSRTFRIGRGAHGQVSVVFPTQDAADLYAAVGRMRRRMRGDTDVRNPDWQRLSSVFGVDMQGIGAFAQDYRDQVMEAIKDLPEDERFEAPDPKTYRTIKESQKSQEEKPSNVQDALERLRKKGGPSELGWWSDVKEALTPVDQQQKGVEAGKLFNEIYRNAPRVIGTPHRVIGHEIYDKGNLAASDITIRVSRSKYLANLSMATRDVFNEIRSVLQRHEMAYKDAKFSGITLGPHQAVHFIIPPEQEGFSPEGRVFINPYQMMYEVWEDDRGEKDIEGLAATIHASLVHEITHQTERGHDEQFFIAEHANFSRLGRRSADQIKRLENALMERYDEPDGSVDHFAEIIQRLRNAREASGEAVSRPADAVFSEPSELGPTQGDSEGSEAGRSESKETVRPGVEAPGSDAASGAEVGGSRPGQQSFDDLDEQTQEDLLTVGIYQFELTPDFNEWRGAFAAMAGTWTAPYLNEVWEMSSGKPIPKEAKDAESSRPDVGKEARETPEPAERGREGPLPTEGREPDKRRRPDVQRGVHRGFPAIAGKSGKFFIDVAAIPEVEPDHEVSPEVAKGIIGESTGEERNLYERQVRDIAMHVSAFKRGEGGSLLAWPAGSGKTFIQWGIIQELRKLGLKKFLIVVERKELAKQWQEDAKIAEKQGGIPDSLAGVDFLTYVGISWKKKLKKIPHSSEYTSGFPELDDYEFVSFDESQALKNPMSNRSQGAFKILENPAMKYGLFTSATPFERPKDMEYITKVVDLSKGEDFETWVQKYGEKIVEYEPVLDETTGQMVRVPKYIWNHDVNDLLQIHAEMKQRGLITFVERQLPKNPDGSPMVNSYLLKVPKNQELEDLYNEVNRRITGLIKKMKDEGWGNDMMFLAIGGMRTMYLRRILEMMKLESMIPTIYSEMEKGRSVAVFTEYRSEKEIGMGNYQFGKKIANLVEGVLEGIEHRMPSPQERLIEEFGDSKLVFPKLGDPKFTKPPMEFTGRVTSRQAGLAKDAFNSGDMRLILVSNLKGGTGLSLHDKIGGHPRTQINLTLPWAARQVEQITWRTARMGMKSDVNIYWAFRPTAEEKRMTGMIANKMESMGALVKGAFEEPRVEDLMNFEMGLLDDQGNIRTDEPAENEKQRVQSTKVQVVWDEEAGGPMDPGRWVVYGNTAEANKILSERDPELSFKRQGGVFRNRSHRSVQEKYGPQHGVTGVWEFREKPDFLDEFIERPEEEPGTVGDVMGEPAEVRSFEAEKTKRELRYQKDKLELIDTWLENRESMDLPAGFSEDKAQKLKDYRGFIVSEIERLENQVSDILRRMGDRGIDVLGEPEFTRETVSGAQRESNLRAWFGDSKVVDDEGKPKVVYHGTTHNFDTFSPERSNPENQFGKGYYFTDTQDDVSINYAGEGPDLTQRIEERIERLTQEIEDDPAAFEELGLDPEAGSEEVERFAESLARKELSGGSPNVMPVYLSIQNPFIIGGPGETVLQYELVENKDGDIVDEKGTLVDFVLALRDEIAEYDSSKFGNQAADNIVSEIIGEGGDLDASDLDRIFRESESLVDITDEEGRLVSSEIFRKALETIGFDGIIDQTSGWKFSPRGNRKGMQGLHPGTTHYVAFKPTQIKSATGNTGEFSSKTPTIIGSPLFDESEMKRQSLENKLADLRAQLEELRAAKPSAEGRKFAEELGKRQRRIEKDIKEVQRQLAGEPETSRGQGSLFGSRAASRPVDFRSLIENERQKDLFGLDQDEIDTFGFPDQQDVSNRTVISDPLKENPPDEYLGAGDAQSRMPMSVEQILDDVGKPTILPEIIESLEKSILAVGKTFTLIREGQRGKKVPREVPILTGRMRMRKARGEYQVQPNIIRLKQALNIETAAHETFHAIEKAIFGFTQNNPWQSRPPSVQNELMKMGKALYGDRKPNGGYKREGWAEFGRYYLTTDNEAQRKAPSTFKWFNEFLQQYPDLRKALEESKSTITRYRLQGAVKRAEAFIGDTSSWQRVKRILSRDNLGSSWVEEARGIEQFSMVAEAGLGRELEPIEDPFKMLSALRHTSGARVWYMVNNGMIDLAGNKVGASLADAANIVRGKRREFTLYLLGKRALERISRGKEPGINKSDAEFLVSTFQTPEFEIAAQMVYEWNRDILNYAVQGGLIPAEVANKIFKRSTDYIPFARLFEDVDMEYVGKLAGSIDKTNPLRMFHGSGRRIKDPFVTMIQNAEMMVRRTHQRMIINSILRLRHIEDIGFWIHEVPRDKLRKLVPPAAANIILTNPEGLELKFSVGKLIDKLIQEVEEENDGSLNTDELSAVLEFFMPAYQPKGQDPVFPAMENGRLKWFQVNASMYRDLAESLNPYRGHWSLELTLGASARAFKLGTTGMRPAFALITNPLRDFQTFVFQTRSNKNAGVLAMHWLHGMAKAANPLAKEHDKYFDAFLRLGGEIAQPLGADIDYTKRAVRSIFRGKHIKGVITNPIDLFGEAIDQFRDILQIPESATRSVELREVASQVGWNPNEPMTLNQSIQMLFDAKRVSVDFSAGGRVAKIVNRYVPFFNPAIQGIRSYARTARDRPLRFMVRGMEMTAMTLALWWLSKDEEWYVDMDWWEKYTYWNIPVGNAILRIPRAFEYGNSFAVIPEALFDAWYRQDPEAVYEAFGHLFETTLPDTVMAIPLVKVAVEQRANRVFFTGQPIVPMSQEKVEPAEQIGPYTSQIAIAIAHAFDLAGKGYEGATGYKELPDLSMVNLDWFRSPRRIDHMIRGMLGGLGPDLLEFLDSVGESKGMLFRPIMEVIEGKEEPNRIPVVGRLFRPGGQVGYRSKAVDELWDELSNHQIEYNTSRIRGEEESEDHRLSRLLLSDATDAAGALSYVDRMIEKDISRKNELRTRIRDIATDALSIVREGTTKEKRDKLQEQIRQIKLDFMTEVVAAPKKSYQVSDSQVDRIVGTWFTGPMDFQVPGQDRPTQQDIRERRRAAAREFYYAKRQMRLIADDEAALARAVRQKYGFRR